MSEPIIQFISAEELQRLAEMEKDQRNARSVGGMLDDIDKALQFIDEGLAKANRPSLMVNWALEEPGEFFKLKARLLGANKEKQASVRIQIGLPMTALDALPEPTPE